MGCDGGGDISGLCSMISINSDTIGVNELDIVDTSFKYLATTDGSGGLFFAPSVSFLVVTPTAGTTTFTLDYNIGQIVVYMNGIKLIRGLDFTASNGTEIVLSSPCIDSTTQIEFQRFGIA